MKAQIVRIVVKKPSGSCQLAIPNRLTHQGQLNPSAVAAPVHPAVLETAAAAVISCNSNIISSSSLQK
jgi:hypothetical protein